MNSDIKEHPNLNDDKETAIRNLGGMVWLYDKHLDKFKVTYADSAEKAREYLQHNKAGDARILIHSVKGLAGTLGLRQLYYAASDLEKAIKTDSPSLNRTLNVYKATLTTVLSDQDKE